MPDRYHFRNFVFEGGGVKGIAYVGAIAELEKRGILKDIKRVGGTSAGAINAVLVGLNYSTAEMDDILRKLNFNNFLDDSWGIIRDAHRLVEKYGWYKGDFFRSWISRIIAAKTGNPEATFADVHAGGTEKGFKDIYLTGTNLSTRFCEVFSFEHTPRMCMADAVRISMSIPLFFTAKSSLRGDLYVDGGLLANYPVKLFDRKKYVEAKSSTPGYYRRHNKKLADAGIHVNRYIFNKETLGFRLDSAGEIAVFRDHAEPAVNKISDFFDYASGLISTILEAQQNMHLHSDDWQRTVYIDTLGVKTTDFDLPDEKKDALVESGRRGVENYFKWYDKAGAGTANK